MEREPLTPGLIIYLLTCWAVVLWYVVITPILAWRSRRRWRRLPQHEHRQLVHLSRGILAAQLLPCPHHAREVPAVPLAE